MYYAVAILIALFVFTVLNFMAKNKKPFKRAFLGMFLGVVSLIAVNIVGMYCDVGVTVSPFSLTFAACGGVPAVIAMVIIGTFL